MRYIFYTFSLLTFSKALRYQDYYKTENSQIVYCDLVSAAPQKIIDDSSIIYIDAEKYRAKTSGLSGVIHGGKLAVKSAKTINGLIDKADDDITLIVFRDNEPQEATIIEKTFEKKSRDVHLWLIEEGSGLYVNKRQPIRKKWIKRVLYAFMGVSQYSLSTSPQGMNRNIEKIICAKPDNLPVEKANGKSIEQQIEIFNDELSEKIVRLVTDDGIQLSNSSYSFVFLTEPMDDFGVNSPLFEKYRAFLERLGRCIKPYGKLVIKPHPRDKYDYGYLESEVINICNDELMTLPFECLYKYWGEPTVLSLYSSANANINSEKESYYLYKLVGIKLRDNGFSEQYLSSNHIIECNDFDDLERRLKK